MFVKNSFKKSLWSNFLIFINNMAYLGLIVKKIKKQIKGNGGKPSVSPLAKLHLTYDCSVYKHNVILKKAPLFQILI